ncbi:MAG: ATP-binding protein [Oscillospiraceae bacterium]|nr:ATP-binding protein [Oscillospiraceae bacterium]
MEWELLACKLRCVSAYQNIAETERMRTCLVLLDALVAGDGTKAMQAYTKIFYALHQEGYTGIGAWLYDRLRYERAPFSDMLERGGTDAALTAAAKQDLACFIAIAELDAAAIIKRMEETVTPVMAQAIAALPLWESGAPFDDARLMDFYRRNGAGLFAQSRAFLWQAGRLLPVKEPDCPAEEALLGYELQREQVVANTCGLMAGHMVNNVLLFGDSGTGKSVTVKHLLSIPEFSDLRLIEVQREELGDLPDLIRMLRGRRYKFILFIDDLAFDQDDRTYSMLKTVLEGGLEPRPANVAVYATSNRRHLVRQTFSDRRGDEVDASETIQEKTSLSDRFGLRIPFLSLNKAEFLSLTERMAECSGIQMDAEELRALAVRWDMHHPGRTPRIARQFIASLYRLKEPSEG